MKHQVFDLVSVPVGAIQMGGAISKGLCSHEAAVPLHTRATRQWSHRERR